MAFLRLSGLPVSFQRKRFFTCDEGHWSKDDAWRNLLEGGDGMGPRPEGDEMLTSSEID
jgi:hypothetical protein